jgi:predicted nucleic acid-binding protein
MIHGLDTGFLVAAEVSGHPDHRPARDTLARLSSVGDTFGLAPQVLAEFVHVVTDPRRFTEPLDMASALRVAELWWCAADVMRVFPNELATIQFLTWMRQYSLGRKRLLDTLLAATYHQAGNSVRSHDQSQRLFNTWRVHLYRSEH